MKGDIDNSESRKKRGFKKGNVNVPLSELGFKAKIYSGIETEYTRRRVKYKAARYGAQNGKECFMGRLTFLIDPTTFTHEELNELPSFKGIKKHEWEKIKQIVYHSRDELTCAICLEKEFRAPQMTTCGHVFCWHCIYMHHYKSLKANNCPVCNETFSITSIITCQPIFGRSFKEIELNKINFALKCRKEGDFRIYNPTNLEEDIEFARILKATSEKVVQIYQKEREELQRYIHECDDEQIKKWLQKVISLSWERIDKATTQVGKKQYKLHKNEKTIDGLIYNVLQDSTNLIHFYQEHSGKFIYLHPLCDKYLRKSSKVLPPNIEQEILYWQEIQYNIETSRRYKHINHIIVNQQIDLIIVQMKNLISEENNQEFVTEYQNFKIKKKDEIAREERESERLQVIYEQEKEYMKKLKKMEESQFYDIRVPTTINPRQLGDVNYFPSLIQVKSEPGQSPEVSEVELPPKKEKKVKQPPKILHEGDFPELFPAISRNQSESSQNSQLIPPQQLLTTKSEAPKPSEKKPWQQEFPGIVLVGKKSEKLEQSPKFQKKGNRRKKEKFVNVTDQFFQRQQENDD